MDGIFTTCLIDYDTMREVCRRAARENNQKAALMGQSERLVASELLDLYFDGQKGLCSISSFSMEYHETRKHPRHIVLDHIVEANWRNALANAIQGGDPYKYGKIACIDNVQWVCNFANQLKESFRQKGFDIASVCRAIADNAEAGFPIRANARHLGLPGRAAFRSNLIREMLAQNKLVSSSAVHEALKGTPGECGYSMVLECMKELGWKTQRDGTYREVREQAIRNVVARCGTTYPTQAEFAELVNKELSGMNVWKNPSRQVIHTTLLGMGIKLVFQSSGHKRTDRSNCLDDQRACLNWLQSKGDEGASVEETARFLADRRLNDVAIDECISVLLERMCVYRNDDSSRLYASLTRQEAARIIGVSKNALRKWAGRLTGPEYMKASAKADTFYRRDVVCKFIADRGHHPLDLAIAGQRLACVRGGSLGGRPKAIAQTIAG